MEWWNNCQRNTENGTSIKLLNLIKHKTASYIDLVTESLVGIQNDVLL